VGPTGVLLSSVPRVAAISEKTIMSPERATAAAGTGYPTAFEQGVVEVAIERIDGTVRSPHADLLAVEEPLEIRLGHGMANARKRHSRTVTMRTPGNDLELAVGFLFAEGVVRGTEDIQRAESCGPPAGPLRMRNIVRVELAPGLKLDTKRCRRRIASPMCSAH
jgi:FdhD protein